MVSPIAGVNPNACAHLRDTDGSALQYHEGYMRLQVNRVPDRLVTHSSSDDKCTCMPTPPLVWTLTD